MKKNKKRKYASSLTVLLLLIIIGLGIIALPNIDKLKAIYISNTLGYKKNTINVFLEEEIYNDITNYEYSETLDKIANTSHFKKENYNDYLNIDYIEDENFLENINILLDKGYNTEEINNLYKKVSLDNIDTFIEQEYFKDINDILTLTFFKEDKLSRYIEYYKKEKNKDVETIVTYVNIGLDKNYYTNIENIEKQDEIDVLVNKYNQLSKNYIPKDLVTINKKYGWGQLQKTAKEAFEKMAEEALKENIKLISGSAYRSYSYQNNLYNNYVKQDGKKEADTYSARPGHSEHQTGLALDLVNNSGAFIEDNGKEFNWLKNNAHKYGFILRYPKEKDFITGYMYEPWHYRYVGIDIATEIHNIGITYDEYVAKK